MKHCSKLDGLVKPKPDLKKNVIMVIGLSKYTKEAVGCMLRIGLGYLFGALGSDKHSLLNYRREHKMKVLLQMLIALTLKDGGAGERGEEKKMGDQHD